MRAHSITEADMGTLYSVFLVTYTLLMTPGGWLADRVGTWWTLLLVVGGSGVFGAMCGLTGWLVLGPAAAWWWIAVARGGMGIASAPIYPSTSRTVADWFSPRYQALANGFVIAAAPVGMGASFQLMSHLSRSEALGWRGAFLIVGVVTLGVAALWALLGRARPPVAGARSGDFPGSARWSAILRHRGIIALTLSYSTVGYLEYLLFYWMKHYFKEILKLEEGRSSNLTSVLYIAMAVGTPLGGWICGIWVGRRGLTRGVRGMAAASMTLSALCLLGGAMASHLGLKVGLLSLSLGFIGASEGPFWTAAVMLGGPLGATVAGFVNTGGNLLGAFAPMLTPRIARWVNESSLGGGDPLLGWTVALAAGSIVCLMGVLFWLWVDVEKPLERAP
jgi:MFS family permease